MIRLLLLFLATFVTTASSQVIPISNVTGLETTFPAPAPAAATAIPTQRGLSLAPTPKAKLTPTTFRPVTPKPVTSQPVTPKPVSLQPVTQKPVSPQPATARPVTPAPVTSQPVTPAPVTPSPVTQKPVTSQPVTNQPSNAPVDVPTTTQPTVVPTNVPTAENSSAPSFVVVVVTTEAPVVTTTEAPVLEETEAPVTNETTTKAPNSTTPSSAPSSAPFQRHNITHAVVWTFVGVKEELNETEVAEWQDLTETLYINYYNAFRQVELNCHGCRTTVSVQQQQVVEGKKTAALHLSTNTQLVFLADPGRSVPNTTNLLETPVRNVTELTLYGLKLRRDDALASKMGKVKIPMTVPSIGVPGSRVISSEGSKGNGETGTPSSGTKEHEDDDGFFTLPVILGIVGGGAVLFAIAAAGVGYVIGQQGGNSGHNANNNKQTRQRNAMPINGLDGQPMHTTIDVFGEEDVSTIQPSIMPTPPRNYETAKEAGFEATFPDTSVLNITQVAGNGRHSRSNSRDGAPRARSRSRDAPQT